MNDLSPKKESLDAGGAASVSLFPSPKAILGRIVRKWYWCVLSLCICLPLSYLYAARQPQLYGKATTILIKDDYPKESVAATVLATSNGIVNTVATNLDNEMFLLSSHSLLETVVRKLKLDVTYWKKDKFRKVEVYEDSPIAVQFTPEGGAADARFCVVPLSGKEFRLEKDEKDRGGQETGTFGKEVRFDSLTFIVEKTPRFSEAALNVPVIVRKTSVRNAAVGLRSGLTVKKANGKNNLVNVSIRCNNPVKAEVILHSIVHFYNEASLKEKNTRGTKTNKFIGERLAVISEEMRKNDLAVEKLKKETNILTDLSTALTEEYENSINDKKDLRELALEIKSIEYLKQYLEEEAEHDAKLVPINSKIADMGIRDQIGVFNDTLLKKTSLKVNAGDNNPIVRELEANLSSLKDALKRSVNNYYTSLLIKKKNIQDQHEKTREHIRNVSSRERDVNYIDREQRVRESLYVFLLNKREENSLALAATEDNARMVDGVRGGAGPLAPNVPKILLVGFLVGLAVPVLGCVIAAMMDSRVKRREEIESLTDIPVYGVLPRKPRKLKNQEIVVNLEEPSELSESFPLLAERLVSLAEENGPGGFSILLTSSCPGEGKTYLAVNLALSLAVAGKKVLLMDMDLRKGTLSSLLGGQGKPGIGDLDRSGEGGWRSLVEKSSVSDHLDYLFAGTLPDHPSRLLLHDRVRVLMEELKEHYDFIFMDCVPYASLADARIVARLADATLYVMRAGCVRKRDLPCLQKTWKNGKLKRMGIVLCDVENHSRSSRKYAMYRSFDTSSPCPGK